MTEQLGIETPKAMQNQMHDPKAASERKSLPLSKEERHSASDLADIARSRDDQTTDSMAEPSVSRESLALMERPTQLLPREQLNEKAQAAKRKQSPQNAVLKRFDLTYWRRLLRYFYIRFLRMQGSPQAIARGIAAGVFAGAFPLLGFQTIIGVAIAAITRGNKIMAAAGTWISNPLTYVPIFALNFQVGCWLLRLPNDIVIPSASAGMQEWMSLGMSATAALMVGSCIVGAVASLIAYYLGLKVALLREKKRAEKK
ncbi:MAG: DUF2062 domain-containing protein [Cyanobacteria bacterium P01_D01_bin.1]